MTIIEPLYVRSRANRAQEDDRDCGTRVGAETVATCVGNHRRVVEADVLAPMLPGLPLPTLRSVGRLTGTYYAVTTVDARGRLADRSPLRALHWVAGLRVEVTPTPESISVTPSSAGRDMITLQGHIRLPARVRRACGLRTGDRLLVVAHPADDLLTAYTMSTLDALFHQHALAAGGAW
jgi:hypothetical protein